jgi:glycosyltransferase involved in cell wall biosynthesis
LRVLHVADRLTDRGGAYWHLLGVLESLAGRHELRLAVGRDEGQVGAPCPVHVVPGLEARDRQPVALDALVEPFAPDLVHVHNVVNPAVLEWAAGRPSLLTIQDHRAFCPFRGKWKADGSVCRDPMRPETCAPCFEDAGYFREVLGLTEERLAAVRRLRVIVLSRYMKDELAAVGVPSERVHVIPPFVHGLDLRAEAEGPPCVLFVGRLVEAKGVAEAIEAWRRSRVGLPLVFAGTGPLREIAEESGLEVLGWLPHGQMAAVYRRARALVFPSRWQEPFGIAGLEALSMGTPVAAWASGGVGEWHPGEGLVPWGDLEALAAALREAIARRASPPPGFERAALMRRLEDLYRTFSTM